MTGGNPRFPEDWVQRDDTEVLGLKWAHTTSKCEQKV